MLSFEPSKMHFVLEEKPKKKLSKEYQKIKKEYEDHKRQKQQQDLMGFT